MNFSDYQQAAKKTAFYPNIGSNFIYPTLGLAGEAGEIANKIKKIIRDKNSQLTDADREDLKSELGDVLWYISQIGVELNITLEDIAQANLIKLSSRQARNVLGGSGDKR
ncbi:hypothetical protein COT98_02920 [Candidatus Falkowbacteria bacterium CG10_big_fil_rev_8_21_14_0_10_39_9]|uniref:NTP pyrophosphohydrolase MazG-like domain-containing protein n=1 Tax=Candidatus Falkowbacteria bacterium CG10_big_fil_rev_8_21_14_0_10_39_9 TaxID=1974566 RepID=A0A2M6WP56_9BACT|nr:MAG: hypothetical protein COT98_02920 [Candidatus Falkowbacteria bacterium CG10_big_fil_rev_8_21_14_0_10_39_9]